MEYTQEPLFYTAEEMVAKVTEALNASYQDTDNRIQRVKDTLNGNIAESLVSVLKTNVQMGDLDKATAQDIYDTMAGTYNWSEASLSTNVYEVIVTLDGDQIASIEIEAENEDEACDLVRDDFTLTNADVSLTFTDGQGNEHEHEITGVEHDMYEYQDSLDFTAEQQ
jgi:pyruvate/2-oxoacid:ferredoxin oxidoreductase alpha subunit